MKATSSLANSGASLRRKAIERLGTFRYSAIELLGALIVLFVITPFVELFPHGDLVEATLLTLVMVSAVLAVGGRGRTMGVALLLVIPALTAKWANHLRPDLIHPFFSLLATMAFFAFVVALLLRFILRAPRVDANVICAAISGYLMLGMLWVPAYVMVTQLSPAAFTISAAASDGRVLSGFDCFYFSFATLCTVGYGDITPVSKAARMLAVMEAITGLFYMAVLISRLVSVYSAGPRPAEEPPAG